MELKATVVAGLDEARRRTVRLLEPLDERTVVGQHSPLMSPLVWDLAHIANYEDIWLVRALGGSPVGPDLDDLYDAFRHPRARRHALDLLGPAAARSYAADVRSSALDLLGKVDLDDPGSPLLDRAFVYGMVIQHEHQHNETMLAALQLLEGAAASGLVAPVRDDEPEHAAPSATTTRPEMVVVEGGAFLIGSESDPWAYDNERPAHEVTLPGFWIDTAPVTNAAYATFVGDGGYEDQRWWSAEGWSWRVEAELEHPQMWLRDANHWARRTFGLVEPLPPEEPVQHVCWYEAEAFARWAGKRLPTEAEWEKAASWDPRQGRQLRYPWGDDPPEARHGNLGQLRLGPTQVGSHPDGASPAGCHDMLGNVWEWTSSSFTAYPGARAFPYREYSEVFYGQDYKVLRGGSWATHPVAVRCTFRNWDFPKRRQIFAGFRCARDA